MSSPSAFGEETDTLDAEGRGRRDQRRPPHPRANRGRAPALHRRDRAGPARLFRAEDRREGRLRPRPRRRRQSKCKPRKVTIHSLRFVIPAKAGIRTENAIPLRGNDEVDLLAPPFPRAPTSARSPATSPMRLEPSAMSPCLRRTRAGPFGLERPFHWTFSRKPLRRAH